MEQLSLDRLTIIKIPKSRNKIIHLRNWLQLWRSNAKQQISSRAAGNTKRFCRHTWFIYQMFTYSNQYSNMKFQSSERKFLLGFSYLLWLRTKKIYFFAEKIINTGFCTAKKYCFHISAEGLYSITFLTNENRILKN